MPTSTDLTPTHLHRSLASQIVTLIRTERLSEGERLKEVELARRLGVSRTPIRGALLVLAATGVAQRVGSGYVLAKDGSRIAAGTVTPPPADGDVVYERLIADVMKGELPERVTENQIGKRYGQSRTAVAEAMVRLEREGVVRRAVGYGWHFEPLLRSETANEESYRFRLIVEPAALLEPSFAVDPEQARRIRAEHESFLASADKLPARVSIFEMNAAFHEALAAWSGNRFVQQAIRQMGRQRRLLEYQSYEARDRVVQSCREHLGILDALDRGDHVQAAQLMRDHLSRARALRFGADDQALSST
jgi:DNA-binding GntR family transcriptional regulator